MYLNDLNSSRHNVEKLNRILADTFKHDVDLSQMSTDSLNRMLTTTNSKMMEIKESNLKYWENPQYNKLGLIAHQIKTYLSEIAPTRSDGKKMKKESRLTEADLDQAEVLLAAQELVDELQKMVEDVAEMQVQKLMPIVDAMKEQIGFDVAEAYNSSADAALGGLLAQMKTAKEAVENATLAARGEPVPGGEAVPTDMGMTDADMDPEAPMDADAGMDMPADEFGGDETEAGEDNAVGRELKGESALADMERGALAEKKFLESKDKLFKMVESGKMSQEHFVNVINELEAVKEKKNKYGVEINPYWDKFRQDNEGRPMYLQGGDDSDLRGFDSAEERDRILDIIRNQGKNRGPETYPKTDRPINRFAPPPTGPGGDQALPRSNQPKRPTQSAPAPRPTNRFAPPPTGPGGDQALPKMKKSKPDTPSGPTYQAPRGGMPPSAAPMPGLPGGDKNYRRKTANHLPKYFRTEFNNKTN